MKQTAINAERVALAETYGFLQEILLYHEQTQERVSSWPRNGLETYADVLHLMMSFSGIFEDINYALLYSRYSEFRNGQHTRRELPIDLRFGLYHEDYSFGRTVARLAKCETGQKIDFIKHYIETTEKRLADCPTYVLEAQVSGMLKIIQDHPELLDKVSLPLTSRLDAFREKIGRSDFI